MSATLDELKRPRTDDEVVRRWLADRGLVAAERRVMERLCVPGNTVVVYHVDLDRYVGRL